MNAAAKPDNREVQWVSVPVADDAGDLRGRVTIGDSGYEVVLRWHRRTDGAGDQLQVCLNGTRRVRRGVTEPTHYNLWRNAAGQWRCVCPAAGYNPHLPGWCKHAAAIESLLDQLVREFSSGEPEAIPADCPF